MLEEKMKDLGDTTLYTGETYVRKKKKKNIEHSPNKKKERKGSTACVPSQSKLAE